MDLSIIIINWNTREMLRDCLNSVFDFAPRGTFEVIVVDNASTDGSAAMIRDAFPTIKLIINSYNRGFAAANNQALKIAAGRNLLLLNSDTLIHGSVLQKSSDYLDTHRNVGAMGCRVLNADGSLQHSTSQFPSFFNLFLQTSGLDRLSFLPALRRYHMLDWDRKTARNVETVSGCYLMVRRTVVDAVGLLDEAFFFFGEETDWCRRIRRAGWIVRFAPVGSITHFGGGSSDALSYRRDIFLTEATVRLHCKHYGQTAGVAVYLLLLAFNLSRAIYWSLKSFWGKATDKAVLRALHFRQVVLAIPSAWPAGKGGMS